MKKAVLALFVGAEVLLAAASFAPAFAGDGDHDCYKNDEGQVCCYNWITGSYDCK
ncbi:hypothetical protein OIV19_20225 [Brucella sp. HL-2]|nr:hypothetical protein [Brucella sp. HL-2]MCV9909930.1 hypothetical protein [Brucella sp. HL-2]